MIKRDKVCCLIHNEGYFLEGVSQSDGGSRRDSIDLSGVFPYLKFLKERFSVQFIGLLCDCLKLSHKKDYHCIAAKPFLFETLNAK